MMLRQVMLRPFAGAVRGMRWCHNKSLAHFDLSQETLDALRTKGIKELFPIQEQTFKHCFEGKDVVGRARTGTGKTLAFALPIVEKLLKQAPSKPNHPAVLIILPTRELCKQVCDEIVSVSSGTISAEAFYGGTSYHQQYAALDKGLDVAVGCPGRLLDHIQNKGSMKLSDVQVLVLDEADRMLDMGFAKEIETVVQQIGADRQTLLFSATLPHWVNAIIKKYMKNEVVVDLIGDSDNQTAQNIDHKMVQCTHPNKGPVIAALIKQYSKPGNRSIVFVERKVDANAIGRDATLRNTVGRVGVLHGDISQGMRDQAMQQFKSGECKVLIATDIAARGIDVTGIDLVVMNEPPKNIDSYIHRSGRTARAGTKGTCAVVVGYGQQHMMGQIQKAIQTTVCNAM